MNRARGTLSSGRTDTAKPAAKNGRVTALARGIEILGCFDATRPELGSSEIAKLTGLAQPTVWRLCSTLGQYGCLTPTANHKWRVGLGLLGLGFAALPTLNIGELALSEMQEIADEFRAAVSLSVPDRFDMLIVERAQSDGVLIYNLKIGSRLPMASSSPGWAYLAGLPIAARSSVLNRITVSRREQWRAVRDALTRELAAFRSQGFIITSGVHHPLVNATSVPIIVERSEQIFALSCGAPASALSVRRMRNELGPRLVTLAQRMQAALAASSTRVEARPLPPKR